MLGYGNRRRKYNVFSIWISLFSWETVISTSNEIYQRLYGTVSISHDMCNFLLVKYINTFLINHFFGWCSSLKSNTLKCDFNLEGISMMESWLTDWNIRRCKQIILLIIIHWIIHDQRLVRHKIMYFLVNYIPTKYIFENIYDIPNLERPWGKIRDVNPFLQNLLRILLIELVCFHQFIGKGIQKRIENMNAGKFTSIIVGNA